MLPRGTLTDSPEDVHGVNVVGSTGPPLGSPHAPESDVHLSRGGHTSTNGVVVDLVFPPDSPTLHHTFLQGVS